GAGAAGGDEVAEHTAGEVRRACFGADQDRREGTEVDAHQRRAVRQGLGAGEVAVVAGLDEREGHKRPPHREPRRGRHRGTVAAELEEVGGDHRADAGLVHARSPARDVRPRKRFSRLPASPIRSVIEPTATSCPWSMTAAAWQVFSISVSWCEETN